jgi:hypothetical protein
MLANIEARSTLAHILPKGGEGVEIGVFKGNFSDLLLRIAQPKTLHLVDPWISTSSNEHVQSLYSQANRSQSDMDNLYADVQSRFAKQVETGRVVIHRETSESAMSKFGDESIDFVYIDGDHTEQAVDLDLELAFEKIKRHGLICGDDYVLGNWWRGGVVRAVNRFIGKYFDQLSIVFVCDHQFVLRKVPSIS